MAKLVAHSGPTAGKEYPLTKDLVVMGRQSTSDIQIIDNLASRAQCNIRRDGRLFSLVDLGSRNGTLLNGKKVSERLLFPGDRIRIGEVEFIFVKEAGDVELKDLLTKYELKKKIGEGGMGIVFTAVQRSMAREVALKILAPKYGTREKFVEQFIGEARAAGKLNHQNLIQVHDVGTENGIHYFSMECVDGPTCLEMVRSQGQLEPGEALEIIRQVSRALEYAHDHRLIHQDIKPDNVMVGTNNVVKLADLGISKTFDEVAVDTPEGEPRKIMGTPHYMAPEAAMGKKIDHRIDLYSLGATLWHLLTGKTVYHGATPTEVLKSHVMEEIPRITDIRPGLSPAVIALLNKLLAKRPEDRFQTAKEVVAEVERIIATECKPATGGLETEILKRYLQTKASGGVDGRLPHSTESTPFEGVGSSGSARFKRQHLAIGAVAGAILVGGAVFFLGQGKPEVAPASTEVPQENQGSAVKSVPDPARLKEDERLKGISQILNQLDSLLAKPADQIDAKALDQLASSIPADGLPADFLSRRKQILERVAAFRERKRGDEVQDAFFRLGQEVERLKGEQDYAGAVAAIDAFPGKAHPRVAKAHADLKEDVAHDRTAAIAELDDKVRAMVTRRDLAGLKTFKTELAKAWTGTPQAAQVDDAIKQVEGIRNTQLDMLVATCTKDFREWNFSALAEHRRSAGKGLDDTPALAQIEKYQTAGKQLSAFASAVATKLEQAGPGAIRFRGMLGGFQDPDLMRATLADGLELKEAKGGAVFLAWAKVPTKDLTALGTLLLKPADVEAVKPAIEVLVQAAGGK